MCGLSSGYSQGVMLCHIVVLVYFFYVCHINTVVVSHAKLKNGKCNSVGCICTNNIVFKKSLPLINSTPA
ncbi:unnamed protein product [Ceratitis capitata]|uniref:(Mediterranean fruit fly) hypothetical protein n=1 Tax=Ceratitis capitata TaxID=7213 RepID=A0A811U9G7_CERCA|nr:unnamed protein product [Ceratitis capitata]